MPQWLQVLRGCLAAYAAGVISIGTVNVLISGRAVEVFGAVAIFGLLAMIPFSVAALILWAVLAGTETRITAWKTIALCGAVFVVFGSVMSAAGGSIWVGLVTIIGSFVVGCGFGVAFWLGAFGLRREVQMGRAKSGAI